MSRPIVSHTADNPNRNPLGQPLERGTFTDGQHNFGVRASSRQQPDSFQVYTGDDQDIVLVLSGLNSGDLKATWGPQWRTATAEWKAWAEEASFRVFYSGHRIGARSGERHANRPAVWPASRAPEQTGAQPSGPATMPTAVRSSGQAFKPTAAQASRRALEPTAAQAFGRASAQPSPRPSANGRHAIESAPITTRFCNG